MQTNSARYIDQLCKMVEQFRNDILSSYLVGLEQEWNLMDQQFRPLDYGSKFTSKARWFTRMKELLPEEFKRHCKPEAFSWMIEWVTRPHAAPRLAVYEARLLEAEMILALRKMDRSSGQTSFCLSGNLLSNVAIGLDCIAPEWKEQKLEYLSECVRRFGSALATAGVHVNLSLPESFFVAEYEKLSSAKQRETSLAGIKSDFYVWAASNLRYFAALITAITAASPFSSCGSPSPDWVWLTRHDSNRNLVFPNLSGLSSLHLCTTHLQHSNRIIELVKRGVLFGKNYWIPTRARNFEAASLSEGCEASQESAVDSDVKSSQSDPWMSRLAGIEIRVDDGGHDLPFAVANVTLQYLLLLWVYFDRKFWERWNQNSTSVLRCRANETAAAKFGMRSSFALPWFSQNINAKDLLRWTLTNLRPFAELLGVWDDLAPLAELADGADHSANKIRRKLCGRNLTSKLIHKDSIRELALERMQQTISEREMLLSALKHLASTNAAVAKRSGTDAADVWEVAV